MTADPGHPGLDAPAAEPQRVPIALPQAAASGLELHGVRVRRGRFKLAADLEAGPGEIVAVLGPNGAGKTTLLRAVAGLDRLESGRVTLDGRVLEDVDDGVRVPAHARRVGFVFQDHLLFDHLSALENVAFGLRATGTSASTARAVAGTWIERMDLVDWANEKPKRLSGGQAARVALARALATDPELVMLDEPLGAVDIEARHDIRNHLRRHLEALDCPCLLVTHDPLEAILLAHRVVVLEDGRVTQTGTLAEITRTPRSTWVARMAGVNLYRGIAAGNTVTVGAHQLTTADAASGEVFALVRPQSVTLYRQVPESSARNVLEGTVTSLEPAGERVRVALTGALSVVAEVTPAAVLELDLARGGPVWAAIKASEIEVYPA